MNREQFELLDAFIDAKIDAALDDNSSSDQGLVTSIRATKLKEALWAVLGEKE